jgi:hypothetical protein
VMMPFVVATLLRRPAWWLHRSCATGKMRCDACRGGTKYEVMDDIGPKTERTEGEKMFRGCIRGT